VWLRYRPNTPQVLKGLEFAIKGGKKVGIVGRTGAGKTTLSSALARIVEIEEGTITIDGVSIKQVPIETLREKITIIPQDATMFRGSLRMNIDPSGKNSDEEITQLLLDAGLESLLSRNLN
jgi:ATP-binding cassette subfamily C (CFTR/MRP) protein 1